MITLAYPGGSPVDLLGLVHVAPATVVQLVGALVPLLVAAVVKRYAQPWVKVATSIVATAIVATVATLVTADGHYAFALWWAAFTDALLANVVAYALLWRKTAVQYIEQHWGDVGLGTNVLTPITGPMAEAPGGAVVTLSSAGSTTTTTSTTLGAQPGQRR